jgi:hypothetical protein
MKNGVFWNFTPCGSYKNQKRGTLHDFAYGPCARMTRKIAKGSTFLLLKRTTRRNILKDAILYIYTEHGGHVVA